MKSVDLSGKRFGMLKIIDRSGHIGKKVAWSYICDCGRTGRATTSNLTSGASTSCGCVRTKHNGKGSRLYRIWSGMKDRCLNPKGKYWSRYGGRGIKICEDWADDFSKFRDWALVSGYQKHLTIDRKDNDNGYRPDNCQWITREENASKKDRQIDIT